jgi:hypothetical protein
MENYKTFQGHGVKKVVGFSDLQAKIRHPGYLKLCPALHGAKLINRKVQALLVHDIMTDNHKVPGITDISGYREADHHTNIAQQAN